MRMNLLFLLAAVSASAAAQDAEDIALNRELGIGFSFALESVEFPAETPDVLIGRANQVSHSLQFKSYSTGYDQIGEYENLIDEDMLHRFDGEASLRSGGYTLLDSAVDLSMEYDLSTSEPTANPTSAPTAHPSSKPTYEPSVAPTDAPTSEPTLSPTAAPSAAPSAVPSSDPTYEPSSVPSVAPTDAPTSKPTIPPTAAPSAVPSKRPTAIPTIAPTGRPSVNPTAAPTAAPSRPADFKIPPPSLSSACFSDDGRFINVVFSAASDRAATVLSNPSAAFVCDDLFKFPGSKEDSCFWSSTSTVRVTIASATDFAYVDSKFQLRPRVIRAACPFGLNCASFEYASLQSVAVCAPTSPVEPDMKIESADLINRCSDIQLAVSSSSGQGSAPWKSLTWEVSGDFRTDHLSAMEEHLNGIVAASSYPSTASLFSVGNVEFGIMNGTYVFSLCGVNMFEVEGCVNKTVTVDKNKYLPSVSVTGVSSAFRYQSIDFYGAASVASCSGSTTSTGITYSYELYDANSGALISAQNTANNPRNFKLLPFTLTPLTRYKLVLTATTTAQSSNSDVLFFDVLRSKTRAIISQGSYTTVFEKSSIALDGLLSYDLDYPNDKSDLAYSWACSAVVGPPYACPVSFSPLSTVLFSAPAFDIAEYQMTLTVRNVQVADSESSADIIVKVQQGLPLPTISFVDIQSKYNRDRRIRIESTIFSQYDSSDVEWSLFDNQGVQLPLSSLALTPLTKKLSSGLSEVSLTVGSNTLAAGSRYVFQLTATYYPLESAELSLTISEVTILINEAPSGGEFLVSPDKGRAAVTVFQMVASGWNDVTDDLPLTYTFLYYTIDPSSSKLLRESQNDNLNSFLGEGPARNGHRVTCILYITDRLGYGTSLETDVVVNPLVITNAAAVADSLAQIAANPDAFRVYSNAVLSSVNSVDCHNAPDCGAMNRQDCSIISNTCGYCLSDFPVGLHGYYNDPCEAATRRALSAAADNKQCPGDCGGQGDCVFTNWAGDAVSSCSALDTSCRATCRCFSGFHSTDCSRNETEMDISSLVKERVCNSSYTAMVNDDVTEMSFFSYVSSVIQAISDTTQLTDFGYRMCASLVIDIVEAEPEFAVTDANLPIVIEAISAILGRGKDIPRDIFDGVQKTIGFLNRYRQLTMSPSEKSVEIFATNIRYFTTVAYLGSLSLSNQWVVAQSALEKSLELDVGSFVIVNENGLNNSVAVTVTIVGVSLWEFLINTGRSGPGSNSSLLEMETRLISGSLEDVVASRFNVVVYNHEPINYSDEMKRQRGTVKCFVSDDEKPYLELATCNGKNDDDITGSPLSIPVQCPGSFNAYVNYVCPYQYDTPVCALWDSVTGEYMSDDSCFVVEYDQMSTTCSCEGHSNSNAAAVSKRALTSTDVQGYDIFARKSVVHVPFEVFPSIPAPYDFGPSDNVIIFIMTLVFTFCAIVGAVYLMGRDNDIETGKFSTEMSPITGTYHQIMNVAAHILCHEYAHTEVYARLARAFFYHSPYMSVFRWRQAYDTKANTALLEQWMILAGHALNFMFVHAILAYQIYDDDGYCQDITTPDKCDGRNSKLSIYLPRCEWRYDGDDYCALRSPLSSVVEVFLLILITCVVVVPLNYMWAVLISCILDRFVNQSGGTNFPLALVDDSVEIQAGTTSSIKSKMGKPLSSVAGGNEINETKNYFKSQSSVGSSMKKTDQGDVIGMDIDIEHELIYVLSESRALILMDDLDDQSMTSPAMHRAYVKKKLRMDANGNIKEGQNSNFLYTSARDRVKGKIHRARSAATGIVSTMMSIKQEELMNSYLIEVFLMGCLPETLRFFASKYFYNETDFFSEWNPKGVVHSLIARYAIFMLPVYVLVALIVIVSLGFEWFSQTTTATWACLVATSIALDCCVFSPMSVYLRHIAIPATFMEELRRIHRRIRRRYKTIVSNMKQDVNTSGIELVHHFNPGCRAARLIKHESSRDGGVAISNNLTNSFLYVSDIDLPVLDDVDDPFVGAWSSSARAFTNLVYLLLLPIYHCTPSAAIDIAIDYVTLGAMILLVLVMYGLAIAAPYAPIIFVGLVVALLIIREKALYHNQAPRPYGLPIDKQAAPLLHRALYGTQVKKGLGKNPSGGSFLNEAELSIVRRALLCWDLELDKPSAPKPATVAPSDAIVHSKVIPVIEEQSSPELDVSPDPIPEPVAEEKPLPIPVIVSVEPVRKREKEYVHLTHHDFRMISECIARYLLSKEEEAVDIGHVFRGVPTLQTIEYVLDDNVMLGTVFSDLGDRKKNGKVIGKIIKTMIERDFTVVIIPQISDSFAEEHYQTSGKHPMLSAQSMMFAVADYRSLADLNAEHIALHPAPETRQALFDTFGGPRREFKSIKEHVQHPAAVDVSVVSPREDVAVVSTPFSPKTPSGRERIQVRSKDYKMISDTVLERLRHEEREWMAAQSSPFPGVPTVGVVDWVVAESGDNGSADSKKHKKIVSKIVSRMIHRDRTVEMTGNIDESKSYKDLPTDNTLIAERRAHTTPVVLITEAQSKVPVVVERPRSATPIASIIAPAENDLAIPSAQSAPEEGVPEIRNAFGSTDEDPKTESSKRWQKSALSVKSMVILKKNLKEHVREFLDTREITFVKNSADLDEEGIATCKTIAGWFGEHPEMEINVESHTNCLNGKCQNGCYLQQLSQQRVDKVKECFLANGCSNIILTKGWGCKHPEYGQVRLVRIYPTDDYDDDGNLYELATAIAPE